MTDAVAKLVSGQTLDHLDIAELRALAKTGRLVVVDPTPADPIAERNRLLREIRCRHYSDKRHRPAAEQMVIDLLRYQASVWRIDRRRIECPHPVDTLRAMQWLVLKTGQRIPQWRQLIKYLNKFVQSQAVQTAQMCCQTE